MKLKTVTIFLLIAFLSIAAFSQKITYANKEYKIKGKKIFFEGKDVSETFSESERTAIFKKLKEQKAKEKEIKKAEKQTDREEKKLAKAEKEQKRQENALDDYDDAVDKLDNAQAKYERLKRKGKLSPNEEIKWLDKIAKLKERVAKKKKKLK